jgi:hypothetical protein
MFWNSRLRNQKTNYGEIVGNGQTTKAENEDTRHYQWHRQRYFLFSFAYKVWLVKHIYGDFNLLFVLEDNV